MTYRPASCRASEPLPFMFIKVGRHVERQLHRSLTECGLNMNNIIALLEIARWPGISRAGLARALQVTPQAIHGTTSHLIEEKLITRSEYVPGFPVEFSVSKAGIEVIPEMNHALKSMHLEIVSRFPPRSAVEIAGTLQRLLEVPVGSA
ncbi:MAG TPA: MarR family winged helix-turn-helix transcriptional regulator [Pseudonocardiaceae bacterium]|nr:MarR family winged helix-turn-helix transcriptional regulator [Pseudonocardiaceae bacterium]